MHYLTVTQTGREGGQTGQNSQHQRELGGGCQSQHVPPLSCKPCLGFASTLPAGGKTPCHGRSPQDQDEMWPQLLLLQHMGTCQGMLNLFPESAASPLCKRLLCGELKWGKMPGCHHSTDWCKETLVWGTEHQSCPGATGEFCYTESQPCSTEHQKPSTLMPQQPLASSRCIPLSQKPRTAAPAAGEPFVCSSQTPAALFPSATGAGAQQGSWCCCLGDAPQCSQASPTQHPPAPRCCAGCLPSPQLCWVYPNHSPFHD